MSLTLTDDALTLFDVGWLFDCVNIDGVSCAFDLRVFLRGETGEYPSVTLVYNFTFLNTYESTTLILIDFGSRRLA